MDRLEAVDGNLIVLHQAADLLRRMDDATYATAGDEDGRSSVGTHFRHVLDHYRSFLMGLPEGRIDYDARERRGPLENDRSLAQATVLGFLTDIGGIPGDLATHPLTVSTRSVADRDNAPDWSQSSINRELQFLVSHTVHHYALIKHLLTRAGFDTGEDFGVAPSTIAAQRHAAECAR
jgi:uncharacterized damage-inducible protein DinB